jgi:hypothetical protein
VNTPVNKTEGQKVGMRGIILDDIIKVHLLRDSHPWVVAFRQRLAQRQAETLDQKYHERAIERQRLETIFDVPFRELMDRARMVTIYEDRFDGAERS